MTKSNYHHGNLKDTLLKISFDFIEKNDIDKLTLKVLSDITGTSRSAIYSHFGSKKALIEEMILNGFVQFDNCLSPVLLDRNTPIEKRLENAARAYIDFARNNKVLYRLLFGNTFADVRMDIMTKNDPNRSGFGALMSIIEEGQKIGLVKKDDAFRQATTIWASLHGLSSLLIDGYYGMDEMYDDLFDDMMGNLLSGLLIKSPDKLE